MEGEGVEGEGEGVEREGERERDIPGEGSTTPAVKNG